MRLSLPNRRFILSLFAAGALAACARGAPELPPDYGSVNSSERLTIHHFTEDQLKLTCSEIGDGLTALNEAKDKHEAEIKSKRQQNQTAGYIAGLLFLPALLATDNSTEAKSGLDDIQTRRDTLIALERFKKCAAKTT